ncbi:MAG: Lrp/AsnC family transcriptional regulator [Candidatus Micrarchaeota archaeon]|nr:Lrp/AsnC family transcriptional regulator [Candidatus Micrarchaeota archaeon]
MAIMVDDKDRRILEELAKDGRDSTVNIARRIGLPRATVHERIRRMAEKGVIKRFTVVPDYSKTGEGSAAFILVEYSPSKVTQRDLATKMAGMKGVYEVHLLAGEWDMLLKGRGESLESIGRLVIDRLRGLEGVGRTVTLACFENVKE